MHGFVVIFLQLLNLIRYAFFISFLIQNFLKCLSQFFKLSQININFTVITIS